MKRARETGGKIVKIKKEKKWHNWRENEHLAAGNSGDTPCMTPYSNLYSLVV
jgi:hypothetical protein